MQKSHANDVCCEEEVYCEEDCDHSWKEKAIIYGGAITLGAVVGAVVGNACCKKGHHHNRSNCENIISSETKITVSSNIEITAVTGSATVQLVILQPNSGSITLQVQKSLSQQVEPMIYQL